MTKDELINQAGKLTCNEEAAAAYHDKSEAMAAAVTATLLGRKDLEDLVGADNIEAMTLNHQNHARFIAAQLAFVQPSVLVETVAWVLRSYQAHGFNREYWPVQLAAWSEQIHQLLPDHVDQILPMYRFLNDHLDDFGRLEPPGEGPAH